MLLLQHSLGPFSKLICNILKLSPNCLDPKIFTYKIYIYIDEYIFLKLKGHVNLLISYTHYPGMSLNQNNTKKLYFTN